MKWNNPATIQPLRFVCGFCSSIVASDKGFFSDSHTQIYICPNCSKPSYFWNNCQIPGAIPGNEVEHLPDEINMLYREARRCVSVNSYTAAVLACRKLLMHIAVAQGAKAGDSFLNYVEYLADKGYVPPNGRVWVDHIRNKGNEANHEIMLMAQSDAEELISFLEMLLKFIYEFPNKIPAKKP
jgi:hypothetical protein